MRGSFIRIFLAFSEVMTAGMEHTSVLQLPKKKGNFTREKVCWALSNTILWHTTNISKVIFIDSRRFDFMVIRFDKEAFCYSKSVLPFYHQAMFRHKVHKSSLWLKLGRERTTPWVLLPPASFQCGHSMYKAATHGHFILKLEVLMWWKLKR